MLIPCPLRELSGHDLLSDEALMQRLRTAPLMRVVGFSNGGSVTAGALGRLASSGVFQWLGQAGLSLSCVIRIGRTAAVPQRPLVSR